MPVIPGGKPPPCPGVVPAEPGAVPASPGGTAGGVMPRLGFPGGNTNPGEVGLSAAGGLASGIVVGSTTVGGMAVGRVTVGGARRPVAGRAIVLEFKADSTDDLPGWEVVWLC